MASLGRLTAYAYEQVANNSKEAILLKVMRLKDIPLKVILKDTPSKAILLLKAILFKEHLLPKDILRKDTLQVC